MNRDTIGRAAADGLLVLATGMGGTYRVRFAAPDGLSLYSPSDANPAEVLSYRERVEAAGLTFSAFEEIGFLGLAQDVPEDRLRSLADQHPATE